MTIDDFTYKLNAFLLQIGTRDYDRTFTVFELAQHFAEEDLLDRKAFFQSVICDKLYHEGALDVTLQYTEDGDDYENFEREDMEHFLHTNELCHPITGEELLNPAEQHEQNLSYLLVVCNHGA